MRLYYLLIISFTTMFAFSQEHAITPQHFGEIQANIINADSIDLPSITVLGKTNIGAIPDLKGNFKLKLAPGTYRVRVTAMNQEPIYQDSIKVIQGQITRLSFYLYPRTIDSTFWRKAAEDDIGAGDVHIITCNMVVLPMPATIRDSIVATYGFYYKKDCTYRTVEHRLYNKTVSDYLDKRNGVGWEDRLFEALKRASKQYRDDK